MVELFDQVKKFYRSDSPRAELLRDILSVAKILILFAVVSQIAFGTWTPMRAIESGSMEPHMRIGDIVFIQDMSRTKTISPIRMCGSMLPDSRYCLHTGHVPNEDRYKGRWCDQRI